MVVQANRYLSFLMRSILVLLMCGSEQRQAAVSVAFGKRGVVPVGSWRLEFHGSVAGAATSQRCTIIFVVTRRLCGQRRVGA